MDLGVFFLLLLAHFIADFPLQLSAILKLRNNPIRAKSLRGNFLHAGIHFFVSFIFLIRYWSFPVFFLIIITALSHGVVDFVKSFIIQKKPSLKANALLFLFDQAVHIVLLGLILICFSGKIGVSLWTKGLVEKFIASLKASALAVTFHDKIVLSTVLAVIGLWGVGVFIRLIFNGMNSKSSVAGADHALKLSSKNEGANDGGFTIGILERIFIILSILLGLPLVIGFILTVKSVARLKKFDDDRFVEMFIIGSFISFISAIFIGYLIKGLLGLAY